MGFRRPADPRPYANSPALLEYGPAVPLLEPAGTATGPDGAPPKEAHYIGAFSEKENCLEEWTVFGPEEEYDTRGTDETENR